MVSYFFAKITPPMRLKKLFEKREWHIESYRGATAFGRIDFHQMNFFQMAHTVLKIMTRK